MWWCHKLTISGLLRYHSQWRTAIGFTSLRGTKQSRKILKN